MWDMAAAFFWLIGLLLGGWLESTWQKVKAREAGKSASLSDEHVNSLGRTGWLLAILSTFGVYVLVRYFPATRIELEGFSLSFSAPAFSSGTTFLLGFVAGTAHLVFKQGWLNVFEQFGADIRNDFLGIFLLMSLGVWALADYILLGEWFGSGWGEWLLMLTAGLLVARALWTSIPAFISIFEDLPRRKQTK